MTRANSSKTGAAIRWCSIGSSSGSQPGINEDRSELLRKQNQKPLAENALAHWKQLQDKVPSDISADP